MWDDIETQHMRHRQLGREKYADTILNESRRPRERFQRPPSQSRSRMRSRDGQHDASGAIRPSTAPTGKQMRPSVDLPHADRRRSPRRHRSKRRKPIVSGKRETPVALPRVLSRGRPASAVPPTSLRTPTRAQHRPGSAMIHPRVSFHSRHAYRESLRHGENAARHHRSGRAKGHDREMLFVPHIAARRQIAVGLLPERTPDSCVAPFHLISLGCSALQYVVSRSFLCVMTAEFVCLFCSST